MPYFTNYSKDDENQSAPGQGQATDSGTFQRGASGAGADSPNPSGSGTIADSSGAAAGASQKNAGNTGSNYQSLDSYLGANADSNFGNQVTSRVAGQQAQGAADQAGAAGDFTRQVQGSNNVPTGDQISGAVENPITADPAQYQQWRNQTYQGPKSISDSGSLQNGFWGSTRKAVTQTGQLAGNENDQYSLLNSYFGGPAGSSSYSSNLGPTGQQGLDLSLAQHTNGYGQAVGNLRQNAAKLQQQGNQGATALQNAASQQAGNVENSANAARSAIGIDKNGQIIQGAGAGALGNSITAANQSVIDKQAQNKAAQASFLSQLQSGSLTPDQLKQYGLDGIDLSNLGATGNSLDHYFKGGPDATLNNTLSTDQLAKIRALEGLAGTNDVFSAVTPEASQNPYTFDSTGLKADAAKGTQINYQKAINSTPVSYQGHTWSSIPELQKVIAAAEQNHNGGTEQTELVNGAKRALYDAQVAVAKKYGQDTSQIPLPPAALPNGVSPNTVPLSGPQFMQPNTNGTW